MLEEYESANVNILIFVSRRNVFISLKSHNCA